MSRHLEVGPGRVIVTRGWGRFRYPDGELRHLSVFTRHLHDLHYRGIPGGRNIGRVLGAYMYCTAVPDGFAFAHSCRDETKKPHKIHVLILEWDDRGRTINDSADFERLDRLAMKNEHAKAAAKARKVTRRITKADRERWQITKER